MSISSTLPAQLNWSPKHKEYIRACRENTINIAEGAIRAGKTIDNIVAFAWELVRTPDRIHLATGSTMPVAKMIIGDANGFGLEHIFRGRCRWGKYKDNIALIISTRTGEKIVIFAGAKNADGFKKIRGNSYGMWIATEINLHHDNTIKEAFNRQRAAKNIKVFWDLNPDNPNAPIYKDYIDPYCKPELAAAMGGVNYQQFTIYDNINISAESLRRTEAQYMKGTVWHRRDILGQRCVAEGLCYQSFADNSEPYLVDKADAQTINHVTIGIDFGGNRSLTTFVATAIHHNFAKLTIIGDHNIKGRKGDIDADVVNREFVGFVRRIQAEYPGAYIKYGFADSEAQYLINGLRKACRDAGLSIQICDSAKTPITQRVYAANTLLHLRRLMICRGCGLLIGGLQFATWDPDKVKDTRLDNFSSDIDILDAFEYSWEQFMKKLLPEGVKKQ